MLIQPNAENQHQTLTKVKGEMPQFRAVGEMRPYATGFEPAKIPEGYSGSQSLRPPLNPIQS